MKGFLIFNILLDNGKCCENSQNILKIVDRANAHS